MEKIFLFLFMLCTLCSCIVATSSSYGQKSYFSDSSAYNSPVSYGFSLESNELPLKLMDQEPVIWTRNNLNILAVETNTKHECYMLEKSPVDLTNLKPLMGVWYETHKLTNNETVQHLCEEVTYSYVNATFFNKNALVSVPYKENGVELYKFIPVSGYGRLIFPGVVEIHWTDLITGEPDNLVYMILGTDYINFVVGYTCETGEKKPEIVIQTRKRNPEKKYIQIALDIIQDLGLPLSWVGCVANPL